MNEEVKRKSERKEEESVGSCTLIKSAAKEVAN